jgi:hypothetical protein
MVPAKDGRIPASRMVSRLPVPSQNGYSSVNASWTYFLSPYPRPTRTGASSRRTGDRGGGDQDADQPHRVRDQPGGLAQAGISGQVT